MQRRGLQLSISNKNLKSGHNWPPKRPRRVLWSGFGHKLDALRLKSHSKLRPTLLPFNSGTPLSGTHMRGPNIYLFSGNTGGTQVQPFQNIYLFMLVPNQEIGNFGKLRLAAPYVLIKNASSDFQLCEIYGPTGRCVSWGIAISPSPVQSPPNGAQEDYPLLSIEAYLKYQYYYSCTNFATP